MNQKHNTHDAKVTDINSGSGVVGNQTGDASREEVTSHVPCESAPVPLTNTQHQQVEQGDGAPLQPGELRSQPTLFLTEAEEIALLRAIERGQEGFIEEEAVAVSEWAGKTRINQYLLDLTLAGRLAIKFREGKMAFVAVNASAAEEPPKASFAAVSKKFM